LLVIVLVLVLSIRVEEVLVEHGAAIHGCGARWTVLAVVFMDQGVARGRHAVVKNAS
jgi:hypothetical protein